MLCSFVDIEIQARLHRLKPNKWYHFISYLHTGDYMPNQAKTQYLQILNIIETSMKPILGQSTLMVKKVRTCLIFQILPSGTRAKFGLNLLGPASNWPQLKAAGGNGRPQKMAPTQVTSSNRTVVAKMFWMLRPTPIIKFQYNRLKPHNPLINTIDIQLWSEYIIPINSLNALLLSAVNYSQSLAATSKVDNTNS